MQKIYETLVKIGWLSEKREENLSLQKPPHIEKTYKVGDVKGQLKVTLPKTLASALNIDKGDKITWKIDRGELILRKV